MDELKKLVRIIKKHGQRSLQIIDREYKSKQPTKDSQLYQAIVSDEYNTDDEIARDIFRTDLDDRNFKITKNRLKEKLLNNLFLLDYDKSDFTEYQRAEYDLLHLFHQGKILLMEGDPENAVKILAQAIKKAIRFEFYIIAYKSLLIVRKQYAVWGKNTIYEKLSDRIERVNQQMKTQVTFEEKFLRILSLVNKSYNASLSVRDEIVGIIPILKKKSAQEKMLFLDVMAEKLKIKLGWIDLDFNKVIESCEYLEEKYCKDDIKQINVDILPDMIYKTSIKAYFVLKEYNTGLEYLKERSGVAKKGTCDWYWLEEYKILLLLGSGQMREASNTLAILKSCRQYLTIDSNLGERIKLYRLYLLYYMPDEKQLYWGFRWEKLIRELPETLDEHRSYQASFLILQYMYFLREVEIPDLKETFEYLKPYSAEHLSRKSNYRTSIFIRMLEVILEKNFEHSAIIERCSNYVSKLKESRHNTDMDQEFEIIPYERLWEEILHIIMEKKDYKHFRFYHLYELNEA